MKLLIIILTITAWWALSVGGYCTFLGAAEHGLFKPEKRYNGNTDRWLREARIAAYCGFGLPLYFISLTAYILSLKK